MRWKINFRFAGNHSRSWHVAGSASPFIRFFACKEDWSLEPPETNLPDEVVCRGAEPFLIVGAMAGG